MKLKEKVKLQTAAAINPTLTRGVKKATKKNKSSTRALSKMDVDSFMSTCLDDTDSSSSEFEVVNGNTTKNKGVNGKSFLHTEAEEGEEEMDDRESYETSDDEEDQEVVNGSSYLDDEAKECNAFNPNESVDEEESETEVNSNQDCEDVIEDDDSDEGGGSDDNVEGSGDSDNESNKKDFVGRPCEDDDDEDTMSATVHKKSLQKLRDTDPEFYKFLEANDKKLLQFNVSDSDSDGEEDKCHKPDDDLQVGSDDSEFEADETVDADPGISAGLITVKLVQQWRQLIQFDKSIIILADVVHAFHAALISVTGEQDDLCRFKVEGSAVFNAVVELCVLELNQSVKRFLRFPSGRAGHHLQPQKSKKWNKVKSLLKSYLLDLLKLMSGVSSPHIISVLLKHLHQMTQFITCFPNIMQKVMKHLINIWGSGEETNRIVAFLCILRLVNSQQSTGLLDATLKQMYLTYVSNSKFTSVTTLPSINFMRRSLVEIYMLNESASYQHVFLYVRQLAIHLRNAITLQKKESVQAVLNWQFIHSIHLWVDLLAENKTALAPLLYPLVQVIIGTIKLIPTTQYFPLRFHCTEMLTYLSHRAHTFIPVLPFILEVLSVYDFNRRHKKASMKPMALSCVLRVTKTEQTENSFKDAVIEIIYQQTLEYLANESHTIGYPDLVVSPLLQLRKFLKTCKVSNYCKKMRSLVDKIEENSRFIEKERKGYTVNLSDRNAIDAWETNVKLKGTPLISFCAKFKAVNKQVIAKRATDNEKLGEYNIPVLKKRKDTTTDNEGPLELFPSDTDSDLDLEVSAVVQKKKQKKKKAVPEAEVKEETDDDGLEQDIVQDLKLDDF